MPLNQVAPDFALLSSLDMRTYDSVEIFQRNGSPVNMPSFSTGSGIYEDLLFFLNGRYSSSTVYATAQFSVATFGSNWSFSINSNDKVVIASTSNFELASVGSSDPFGFGNNTISATLSGSTYFVTASNDWTRGLIDLSDCSYKISDPSSSNIFYFPDVKPDIQDVSVFARSSSGSDSDYFGLTTLETLDNTVASSTDITWTINNSGFVQCHYRTSLNDIVWSSNEIRNLLGFTGNEEPVIDGTISRLTASKVSPACLFPTRPIQSQHLSVENVSQYRRFIGGGYASNFIGSYVTTLLNFDLDAQLDSKDDYRHFSNLFAPRISGGERINLYQCWGDSRRALREDEVNANQAAYTSLYTSEENGERGRLRGSCLTPSFDLAYPGRLHRRVPIRMEIEHL